MVKPRIAKLIKKQSQLLKKELEGDIDHKLKKKILSQQSEIQNLRLAIEQLKTDNDDVSTWAGKFCYWGGFRRHHF